MEKQYKIPAVLAILSAIMGIGIFLDDGYFKIGLLINKILPCETPQGDSFPCYGLYSIYLFLFLFIVFVLSTGYILELRRRAKKNLSMKPISMILTVLLRGILISVLTIAIILILSHLLSL